MSLVNSSTHEFIYAVVSDIVGGLLMALFVKQVYLAITIMDNTESLKIDSLIFSQVVITIEILLGHNQISWSHY